MFPSDVQDVLRFRDDSASADTGTCLNGSVAQFDYYEARAAFGVGPKDLTSQFSLDPYMFQICISGTTTCISLTERCE